LEKPGLPFPMNEQTSRPNPLLIREIVGKALKEDLAAGDITTDALIPPGTRGEAAIKAREKLVLAGMEVAREVFGALDPKASFRPQSEDGADLREGEIIATATGEARALLSGERVALNFLQRLSGVATLTREFVERVRGIGAVIVDTRKTTPNLRALEKYAVRVGGGRNHRQGLYDMYLIKDNHISIAGGVGEAVRKARERASIATRIEVEVTDLAQVGEALEAGTDIIMLDNMPINEMKEAVRLIEGRALVEASGGISLENVRAVAETGVDYISVGALTHSARAVDISMDVALIES